MIKNIMSGTCIMIKKNVMSGTCTCDMDHAVCYNLLKSHRVSVSFPYSQNEIFDVFILIRCINKPSLFKQVCVFS